MQHVDNIYSKEQKTNYIGHQRKTLIQTFWTFQYLFLLAYSNPSPWFGTPIIYLHNLIHQNVTLPICRSNAHGQVSSLRLSQTKPLASPPASSRLHHSHGCPACLASNPPGPSHWQNMNYHFDDFDGKVYDTPNSFEGLNRYPCQTSGVGSCTAIL